MGWRERDYHRSTTFDFGRAFGDGRPPWGVIGIVALHVLLYALFTQTPGLDAWAARHAPLADATSSAYGIVLHPWSVTSIISLFFTLLAIAALGAQLERRLGTLPLLALYALGNLAAGVGFFALTRAAPYASFVALTAPIGGLAAWIAATWRQMRDESISIFGHMAPFSQFAGLLAFGFIVLLLAASRQNPIGWVVALSLGAVVGLARTGWLRRGRLGRQRRRRASEDQLHEAFVAEFDSDPPPPEIDIDDLLAKISANGLKSLSAKERARLEEARREMIRRSPQP